MIATVGVMLAALVGFTGLAVDVANGYVVREILQHAVDDGARTAQRWSTQVDDPGVNPGTALAQAVAAALDTARRDVQAHGLAGAAVVDAATAGSRLRIVARASVRTWFLRPFGIMTFTPSASADIVLWAPAPAARATSGVASPAAVTSPVFPSASGAAPVVTLPEAPGNPGGAQSGDTSPGPGPSDGLSGGSDAPGGGGGNVMEGP